tara:strand:- start:1848 stop:2489 length:642 start_codon:yes stop_codon:yes gene_type:complete
MISDSKKFIFVHINRTAGTSVETVLYPFCRDYWQHEHISVLLKKRKPSVKYFSFAIVRNPWTRILSNYLYNCKRGHATVADKSFKEYLKIFLIDKYSRRLNRLWYNSCFNWITDENDNILVDVIIRFENLDEGWLNVVKLLDLGSDVLQRLGSKWQNYILARQKETGQQWIFLPHRNRLGRKVDWKTYYDGESIEMVREHFSADIDAFGYSYD